jgi:integrase
MAIKKTEVGWLVDVQPAGRGGKRHRKTFKTQAEAKQWEAWLKTQINQNRNWAPAKRDIRRLSSLVTLWFDTHGSNLSNAIHTLATLKKLCVEVGDPIATSFTPQDFTNWRTTRINAGIAPNTVNHAHAYLRAVFNHLIKINEWKGDNPLSKINQIKIHESESKKYLTLDEIERLLEALKQGRNPHAYLISKICLATGGRWDEVEKLKTSQLQKNLVQFANVTKSKKARAVAISAELMDEIKQHCTEHPLDNNQIFESANAAFRHAVKRAKIELVEGQLTHVLRHTFASHFVMQGRNLLTLQKILGHQNYVTTMRYAHLAPNHMEEAVQFNPLEMLKVKNG